MTAPIAYGKDRLPILQAFFFGWLNARKYWKVNMCTCNTVEYQWLVLKLSGVRLDIHNASYGSSIHDTFSTADEKALNNLLPSNNAPIPTLYGNTDHPNTMLSNNTSFDILSKPSSYVDQTWSKKYILNTVSNQ